MSDFLGEHLQLIRAALKGGLSPRRQLGQHFLLGAGILRRIVTFAGVQPGSTVLEVGPGPGSLTAALIEAGARVVAVELDSRWAEFVDQHLGQDGRVQVVPADAMAPGLLAGLLAEHVEGGGQAPLLVSNLPYQIASPLLVDLVSAPVPPSTLVVTIQAEVAGRILAPPGGRQRGLLTLLLGLRSRSVQCMRIGPGQFTPRPKVSSTVLKIDPDSDLRAELAALPWVEPLLRRAFQGRRKMLRKSLRGLLSAAYLERLDEELLTLRPQDLEAAQWRALARSVESFAGPPPGG